MVMVEILCALVVVALGVWATVEILHHSQAGNAWRGIAKILTGHKGLVKWVGDGMSCPFCYSHWFAIAYVAAVSTTVMGLSLLPACVFAFIGGLAAARLSNLLNDYFRYICRTPNLNEDAGSEKMKDIVMEDDEGVQLPPPPDEIHIDSPEEPEKRVTAQDAINMYREYLQDVHSMRQAALGHELAHAHGHLPAEAEIDNWAAKLSPHQRRRFIKEIEKYDGLRPLARWEDLSDSGTISEAVFKYQGKVMDREFTEEERAMYAHLPVELKHWVCDGTTKEERAQLFCELRKHDGPTKTLYPSETPMTELMAKHTGKEEENPTNSEEQT